MLEIKNIKFKHCIIFFIIIQVGFGCVVSEFCNEVISTKNIAKLKENYIPIK